MSLRMGPAHGTLTLHTGVEGRAAAVGHRLTLTMTRWTAEAHFHGDAPTSAHLTVELDSLDVTRGEGGLKPLSGPERALVRSNALGSLSARTFPAVEFDAPDVESTADGFRLIGTLAIAGDTRPCEVMLDVAGADGGWTLSVDHDVRQSDFGIRPYSQMLGALRVTDEVRVEFRATVDRDELSG